MAVIPGPKRGPLVALACAAALGMMAFGDPLHAQSVAPRGQAAAQVGATAQGVTLRFVDTDLRALIAAVGSYLPKPIVAAEVPGVRVSLETPSPVSRAQVAVLLKALVESHNLQFVEDSALYRISTKPAPPPPPPQVAADAAATGDLRLFVIRLKHARAADVAATVNQLFGGGGEFAGRGGLSTGTLSDELRRNAVSPYSGTPGAPEGSGAAVGRAANLAGPVVLVPDAQTNSLLVRARSGDYQVIASAVDQLDIRPLQVLIEVAIVEARHDRSFALGADIHLPQQNLGGDQTVEGRLLGQAGPTIGDVVVHFMGLGKANVDAFLSAAQSRGDVQIISRPVLLASNNTEAHLLVGSQRPFVQVSRALPTDNAVRDQVVQYKDVGTKLVVRPTINQDGYVSLQIQQEVNAATNESAFDAPVISTRETATQVLVRDGQTIILGGLRDL